MNQESLSFPPADIYDALKQVVTSLGGAKRVGAMLWPDMREKLATDRVNHCLTPQRAEKFAPCELDDLGERAQLVGCHALATYFGQKWGYDVRPVARQDKKAELQRQFIASVEAVQRLAEEIKAMQQTDEQRPQLQMVRR